MDTDIFIIHVKTEDTYKEFEGDNETRLDTSHFILDKPFWLKAKIKMYLD